MVSSCSATALLFIPSQRYDVSTCRVFSRLCFSNHSVIFKGSIGVENTYRTSLDVWETLIQQSCRPIPSKSTTTSTGALRATIKTRFSVWDVFTGWWLESVEQRWNHQRWFVRLFQDLIRTRKRHVRLKRKLLIHNSHGSGQWNIGLAERLQSPYVFRLTL